MRFYLERVSQNIFRLALAAIFAYFGYLALADPVTTASRFVDPNILNFIKGLMDIKIVMIGFGLAQIAVALAIASKFFIKFALVAAALMLIGIIVNLGVYTPGSGINELALRDIVILTGVIYLFTQVN